MPEISYIVALSADNVKLKITTRAFYFHALSDWTPPPKYANLSRMRSTPDIPTLFAKLNGATLATAESCTGGAIAARITAVAGASACFKGGIVAYSNEAKISCLGVDHATIAEYGAVSVQVTEQMARGARRVFGADYAVAVSGVAGPDGGSAEKPVGTVCFSVATPDGVHSERVQFPHDRAGNIAAAADHALSSLLRRIRAHSSAHSSALAPATPCMIE